MYRPNVIREEYITTERERVYREIMREKIVNFDEIVKIVRQTRSSISQNKSFKIEVGYSRRFPLLKQEIEHKFVHPRTLETSRILLPQTEELFGNKCSTLLARRSTRDVYDVANISKVRCQKDLLRKTLVLDNLMQAKANFAKIDIEEYLQAFHVDDRIRHVVRGANISKKEFEEIREIAANFLVQI